MMGEKVIETFAASKRYRGGVLAVDGVDLSVRRGAIYGFLGLNGAGKSTLIRMLLGMVRPTSGHVELFGRRIRSGSNVVWNRVGHLVDRATAYPELTVRENLEAARRLHSVQDRSSVSRALEELGLVPYAHRRARELSLGNLQRLALARALLHRPELLILDEPTNGLDPAGVVEVRKLLRRLAGEEGVTVFLSSHDLAEVERMATRIGVLHRGRLIEEIVPEDLEKRRARRLQVGVRDKAQAILALEKAGFSPIPSPVEGDTEVVELQDARALKEPDEVARVLASAGIFPTRLVIVQEELERHFLRITDGEGR